MNDSITELQQYLQNRVALLKEIRPNQGWKYVSFEELILDCGRAMKAKPMPKNIKRGFPQNCYYNSQKIAFSQHDFTYVEGYAVAEGISLAIALGYPETSVWIASNIEIYTEGIFTGFDVED